MVKEAKKKIIIVGGGPGGVSSAMILASRGFEVTLLEKKSQVGGRNGCIEVDGYKYIFVKVKIENVNISKFDVFFIEKQNKY